MQLLKILAVFCIAVLSVAGTAGAQSEAASDIWSDAVMPLSLEDGSLAGPGAQWLKQRAGNSQFIIFGEQHGVAGLPDYVSATYGDLYADGFHYFGMERGPWFAARLSAGPVDDVLRDYPHSMAFDYDEEVALLEHVESRFEGEGHPFWGLDQEITAIHPLHRLSAIAPSAETRRLGRGLYLKSVLKGGEYIRQDYSRDLTILREAMGDEASPEAKDIISSLLISQQIYVDWRKGNRGEQPMEISVSAREQYMMELLDSRLAAHGDGGIPRAIIKMGGAHVYEGIGPNGVETLGLHAERVAGSNGLESLSVAIRAYDTAANDWLPAAAFAGGDSVLIDTRQLLAQLSNEQRDALPQQVLHDLDGYDALLLLQDAGRAPNHIMREHETAFRDRALTSLFGGLVAAMLLLATGLVMVLRFAWRSVTKGGIQPASRPMLPGLVLLVISLGGLALLALQVQAILEPASVHPAALTGTFFSAPALVALVIGGIVLAGVSVVAMMRGWWGPAARVNYILSAAGAVTLIAYMYYWNLGGMLGG